MRSPFVMLSLLITVSVATAASAEQPPKPTSIRVEIKNLRNNKGRVGCMIFNSADGFPNKPEKSVQRLFVHAFLVREDAFDPILERMRAAGARFYADPFRREEGRINHLHGGRTR